MDITKCTGKGCPVRDKCRRYTSTSDEMQSWFAEAPFTINKKKFECEMFWGNASDLLMAQLKSIVGKK